MSFYRKINCRQNDNGAWCKDKRVKRSLLGIGARVCMEYDNRPCQYKHPNTAGPVGPPPPHIPNAK